MRTIRQSKEFKHNKRKLDRSGRYHIAMEKRLTPALIALANDEPLDPSYYDHPLKGEMKGHRECHILFDLLLLYRYEGDDVLYLEALNTHSETLGL
ncbi:MAG: type II toxin-antitoxin system YafQ family toxin [Synergistaceae bacterium]|nr:type II toxin-antitoxin system YafQ family toxin [Synergistaceae bacterium]MBR0257920.1 type II toxin-antitoxin system YafQ family toxin [Synergistaceae bacterium]